MNKEHTLLLGYKTDNKQTDSLGVQMVLEIKSALSEEISL
jgi:hypothetical protein